jgi:Aspartyl protease
MRAFTLTFWLLVFTTTAIAARKGQSLDLPFKLRNQLVLVNGDFGDAQKHNFLIDTGGLTIIDRSVLHPAELTHTTTFHVIDGEVEGYRAVLPLLHLGPIEARALPVTVMDLSFMQSTIGARVDALIGLDVLQARNFHIDYACKRVRFENLATLPGATSFEREGAFVAVRAGVGGKPARLLVDTGTVGLILFRARFDRPFAVLAGRGVTNLVGSVSVSQVQPYDLRLGPDDLGKADSFVTDDPQMARFPFDGMLGVSALRFREIGFDFERHLFTWRLQNRQPRPGEESAMVAPPVPSSRPSGLMPERIAPQPIR